jgi:predicted methyltransferase
VPGVTVGTNRLKLVVFRNFAARRPAALLHSSAYSRSMPVRVAFPLILLLLAGLAHAGEIDAKVEAALAAESRPEADTERDRNRKPLATLKFFGLEDDMTVLELIPGGGWYTRVLAPVLAENGKLYVALGTNYVSENVLTEPGFEKVGVIETDANIRRPEGSRYYALDDFEFGLSGVDMVLTFRNVHNFDAESRARMNRAVFDTLKSGGLYGVVDHTKRHMEPENPENRRRIDPVLVIKEMLDIGFEFVGYSDLHYRADDELRYEVGRHSVTGNTDRFTFLFRKP